MKHNLHILFVHESVPKTQKHVSEKICGFHESLNISYHAELPSLNM